MRLLGLSPLALGSIFGILLLLTHAYQNWEEWFADNTLPLDEAGNPEMTVLVDSNQHPKRGNKSQYILHHSHLNHLHLSSACIPYIPAPGNGPHYLAPIYRLNC